MPSLAFNLLREKLIFSDAGKVVSTCREVSVMVEKLANPAPLGLMGFGMTTVLLNFHNMGLYPLGSMILAMGIFYGGLAQVIAGIAEFRKGNTFGTTAFSSYGLFWLSLVALLVLPEMGVWEPPSSQAMASYFFMWGLFTLLMFFGTLKINRVLQFVFLSLVILFFLLTAKELMVALGVAGVEAISVVLGVEGVICGLSAIYLAIAEVINEVYGKMVVPIFPVKKA